MTQTFSVMHQQITPDLFFSGVTVDNVEHFTFLGAVFDSKLSWKKEVEYLSDRVTKRLTLLVAFGDVPNIPLSSHIKNIFF